MTKSELRKKYRTLRKEFSFKEIDDLSIVIANNLLKLDIWKHDFYHVFLPIEEQREVNTEFILNILTGKDKNVLISKSDFDTLSMTHYLLTDNTKIKKNNYNIPEPIDGIEIPSKKIDVVFVPLLGYDSLGNRVGYGKGFYDRFLSNCREDVIKIGLSVFEPEEHISDIDSKDLPLQMVVTPSDTHRFTSNSSFK